MSLFFWKKSNQKKQPFVTPLGFVGTAFRVPFVQVSIARDTDKQPQKYHFLGTKKGTFEALVAALKNPFL
jgi:hypothetical protein